MNLQQLLKLQRLAPYIYTIIGVGSVLLFVALAIYFLATS